MIERIQQILDTKNLSATQFSEEIGIQRSSISHVLSGRNKPSLDFMLKIKGRYPEINLNWLLLGDGKMIEKEISSPEIVDETMTNESQQIDFGNKESKETHKELPKELPADKTVESQASYGNKVKITDKEVETVITLFADGSFKIYRSRE